MAKPPATAGFVHRTYPRCVVSEILGNGRGPHPRWKYLIAVSSNQVVHTRADQAPGLRAAVQRRARLSALLAMGLVAAALPLIGFVSLLLRSDLDPHIENYPLHFVVFGLVGAVAFGLGYAAGEAANRRGDARVLLLSLAFMATGGFLLLHALGTPTILFSHEHPGFQVAIPVGLLVSAVFATGSAFVDVRPGVAAALIRRRTLLRLGVLVAMGSWFVWTLAELPPLGGPDDEAATNRLLIGMAVLGTIMYAVSAARYWRVFRSSRSLLSAAVVGCFVLLSEAMIGVAVTGERQWHASWWEWHGLIVAAYVDRRLGCSTRMARRAVQAALPADDTGTPSEGDRPLRGSCRILRLRRALIAGGGRGRAQRLLGGCGAADHPSVRGGRG